MIKSSSFAGSIFGVLFGILLVLCSPLAMWFAQSQHTAKDFAHAAPVEATSNTTGYIKFSGAPTFVETDGGSACIESSCIYQKESQQELITTEERICGSSVQNTETQRIIQQNGTQCDDNGANCVPCYDVEKDSWEEQNVVYSLYDITVGSYVVKPTQSTLYLDTKSKTVETGYSTAGNETRSVYDFFPTPTTLMVAGASNGSMVTAGEKTFVLSPFDDAGTYDALRAKDKSAQIMLWIVTFLMLFIGIRMILGPLTWISSQFRFIPIAGSLLSQGSSILVTLAAFIIAIPLWLLLFVLVVLIKLWWLALIILIVLIALAIWRGSTKQTDTPVAAPKT